MGTTGTSVPQCPSFLISYYFLQKLADRNGDNPQNSVKNLFLYRLFHRRVFRPVRNRSVRRDLPAVFFQFLSLAADGRIQLFTVDDQSSPSPTDPCLSSPVPQRSYSSQLPILRLLPE